MGTARVTVIVVNWNGGKYLRECISKLLQQTLLPSRILVMDNGSTDGSAEGLSSAPEVTIRLLGENLGFARANNLALTDCDTDFVALLNPDAFPEACWLEKLVDTARTSPDVAAFGSRQMSHDRPGTLDGIGDVYHFSGLIWRDGHGRLYSAADNVEAEIFSPCAGAALYRRSALVAVGAFDEDYFCYVEDVDLGFRLRLAGYKSMYVPDSVVHHIGSASTGGKHSDFAVYHGHRNLVWTFIKNMPGALFWILLPLHIMLNAMTLVHFSIRGQGGILLRAKWDAMKGIPRVWRKRRKVQETRSVSLLDIWRVMDKRIVPSRKVRGGALKRLFRLA